YCHVPLAYVMEPQSVTVCVATANSTRSFWPVGVAYVVLTQTSSSVRDRSPSCLTLRGRPKSSTSAGWISDRVVAVAADAGDAPGSPRDDCTLAANAHPRPRQASTLLLACDDAKSYGYTISEQTSGPAGSDVAVSERASYS